jgi:glutathione S-transferase
MALAYGGFDFQIREVILKHKPQQLLDASAKATVPVLIRDDEVILDESMDIIDWSLGQSDPAGWKDFPADRLASMASLIDENDRIFKDHLDHYKYSDQHPEFSKAEYRERGERFLAKLEGLLVLSGFRQGQSEFLYGDRISYADVAIFPFVRQFANVEPAWFKSSPYPKLKRWLSYHLDSPLFASVMKKYPAWKAGDPATNS